MLSFPIYRKEGDCDLYTILVEDNHSLVTTQRERIMQRSKLVNKMHFLVPTDYDGLDVNNATVCLEYLKPISREYKSEILTLSKELYKNHYEYMLPFDTELTAEHGELELQLTFIHVVMDEVGNVSQHVRKTEPATITITPIAAWSDVIPDGALTALDQRLIKTDMMIQQMYDINMALADSVPDDLILKDGRAYLSKDGDAMSNTIGIPIEECKCEDGVPVIDFTVIKPDDPNDELVYNVVEF